MMMDAFGQTRRLGRVPHRSKPAVREPPCEANGPTSLCLTNFDLATLSKEAALAVIGLTRNQFRMGGSDVGRELLYSQSCPLVAPVFRSALMIQRSLYPRQ